VAEGRIVQNDSTWAQDHIMQAVAFHHSHGSSWALLDVRTDERSALKYCLASLPSGSIMACWGKGEARRRKG
jgi:hypothetical protein